MSANAPGDGTYDADAPLVTDRTIWHRFLSIRTLLSFGIAAGLLVLVWVIGDLSFEDIVDDLSHANPWLVVAAYAVYVMSFPLRAMRWRILLNNASAREQHRPRYTLWALFQILYVSWFVNGIIPLKIGDLYRAYMARANYGSSLTRTLGTIFAERVFDVITLIGIVLVSSIVVLRLPEVADDVGRIIFIAAIALLALVVAVFAMLVLGKPVFRLFPARIGGIYDRFHSGSFDSVSWRSVPLLWGLSIAVWFAEMGRLMLVTRSLGLELELGAVALCGAAASLLLAVPTPGGLGAVEGGLIGLLRVVGVTAGPAAAVAIIDRFISYWSVTITGALLFAMTRLRK